MESTVLLDAIGEHLDRVEMYVGWVIILAIAVAWAGIRRERMIEALGVKFDRRHAFFSVAALYLIVNMTILILFLRIGDLLVLLPAGSRGEGITKLMTHAWVLNPFSHFGGSRLAEIHSADGIGLLIATWWLCNTSLATLMDNKKSRAAWLILGLFLALGFASLVAIQRTFGIMLDLAESVDQDLYRSLVAGTGDRAVGSLLGIAVGVLMFSAANVLQARWLSVGRCNSG